MGQKFEALVKVKTPEMAQQASKLLTTAGAQVTADAAQVKVTGDWAK